MNLKKWLIYTFTPILAASMMSGVAMASKHKKKTHAKTTASQTTQAAPAPAASHAKTSPKTTQNASASETANAKAKGLVWVNTESKVYHTGGKYYGNTKHGKFMTAAEAKREGYKPSKR